MMRQLADLLNSFAGSAARLQSSLPTPPTAGMPPGAVGGGAVVPPPPLSPHAAAAHPALAAAEAALMAKLAGGASGCNAEYAALLRLNDRLGLQGRFVAAATHPELNRRAHTQKHAPIAVLLLCLLACGLCCWRLTSLPSVAQYGLLPCLALCTCLVPASPITSTYGALWRDPTAGTAMYCLSTATAYDWASSQAASQRSPMEAAASQQAPWQAERGVDQQERQQEQQQGQQQQRVTTSMHRRCSAAVRRTSSGGTLRHRWGVRECVCVQARLCMGRCVYEVRVSILMLAFELFGGVAQ